MLVLHVLRANHSFEYIKWIIKSVREALSMRSVLHAQCVAVGQLFLRDTKVYYMLKYEHTYTHFSFYSRSKVEGDSGFLERLYYVEGLFDRSCLLGSYRDLVI